MRVTIVDLGYGNIGSIRVAFERLGAEVDQSNDPARIEAADRAVLPGVGSAGFAMQRIRDLRLERVLSTFRRPFLGICVGMQLMFDWSEESGTSCLGLIKGNVRRIDPGPDRPVPHMGWSRLRVNNEAFGLRSGDYAWFAHSFVCDPGPYGLAHAQYDGPIPAAVSRGNFLGCQFHPERSSKVGARFLRAFLAQ